MKLNKLVIAMGLASVALTACHSHNKAKAPEADFAVKALDGYIVNGLVTASCGGKEYEARTDAKGVAELAAEGNTIEDCTVVITGDKDTYDADDGEGTAWEHTMKTLPGQDVINPFTNIAFTFSQVEENKLLDEVELKNKVLEALGFDNSHAAAAVLFDDYAAKATTDDADAETAAETALLAQGTFDATVEASNELGEKSSAENLVSLFDNVLETVQESVTEQIKKTKAEGNKLSDSVITVVVTLPDLDFSEDGKIKTDNLKYLAVGSVTQEKSELTDPVKVAEATKAAAKDAEEKAAAAADDATPEEKIARQAVAAKAVVKKAEAQQVVAEKVVVKAETALKTVAPEAKAEAEAELAAAKALKNAAEASKEVAENSAKVAKDTVAAEKAVKNATGEDKAAAEKALEEAKAKAKAEAEKVKAEEAKVAEAAEAAKKAAEEAKKAAEEAEKATGADGSTDQG